MVAVAHVEASDVHTRLKHCGERFFIFAGRAKGGDHLGALAPTLGTGGTIIAGEGVEEGLEVL